MNKNYVCNNRLPERGNKIRERPILFSGAMVRAILEGRKTMTRRVAKPQPHAGVDAVKWQDVIITGCNTQGQSGFAMMRGGVIESEAIRCPYGQPGDRLWVRETFRIESVGTHVPVKIPYEDVGIVYAADGEKRNIHREYPSALSSTCHNNKPSIFMPRWASRITLEVTGVRVERLLEISEHDARLEGIDLGGFRSSTEGIAGCEHRIKFRELWESINGPGSWDANSWVWVVEFRRVEK